MVDKHSHIELYEPKNDGDWQDFAQAVGAQINRLKFGEKTMDNVDFMGLLLEQACQVGLHGLSKGAITFGWFAQVFYWSKHVCWFAWFV